jgi:cellulose biosynthesis protein BcsQ
MTPDTQTPKAPAMVVTFYSFKGGVGRSMTLANVASLLSKWGKRVLITDWDLEAPGIEKFFAKWLREQPGPKDGIVDLITAWSEGSPMDWRSCVVKARPQGGQEIHIITAGKDDGKYVTRLRAIDWQALFEGSKLGNYLERLRREWKAEYDFVFIDSRTGVTDIGGICTIHLPDVLVAMFVANDQSLKGVKSVLESAGRGHSKMPVDRTKLMVIPVPSRDESTSEHDLAEEWRNKFASELKDFFADWVPRDEKHTNVLNYLKIPYFPYWSFGERVPVLEQPDPDNPKTLAYAYQPLAKLMLGGLDWAEVREGSLATEQALKQAAEAERLKVEAARITEAAKLRSDQARATQMEIEAQDRKARIAEFEDRVEFERERWRRLAIRISAYQQITIIAATGSAAACLGLLVYSWSLSSDYLGFLHAAEVVFGALSLAGMMVLSVWNPGSKSRTAQLIASRLSTEHTLFRSRANPYSMDDPEKAFRKYVGNVEAILSEGERDYLAPRLGRVDRPNTVSIGVPQDLIPEPSPASAPAPVQVVAPPAPRESSIPPSAHRHDVFLSYRRAEFTARWLSEFMPLFTFWLGESLGRDAVVFHDESIDAGQSVPQAIEYALQSSRSFVAICTPSYFQSERSRAEWEYFARRSPRSIVPILFGPGIQLPDTGLLSWDFSRFTFVGDGFRQTELYVDFQRAVQELAKGAAEIIREAPPFHTEADVPPPAE